MGMRSEEWEGGSSLIMMRVRAGGRGQAQVTIRKKKNRMMSFFTGTFAEMKSGHTQWSCSMPRPISVTRDYFVVMLLRRGLRTLFT